MAAYYQSGSGRAEGRVGWGSGLCAARGRRRPGASGVSERGQGTEREQRRSPLAWQCSSAVIVGRPIAGNDTQYVTF